MHIIGVWIKIIWPMHPIKYYAAFKKTEADLDN